MTIKQTSDCLRMETGGRVGEGGIIKRYEETLGDNGYVLYLHHGDSFLGTHMSKCIKLFTLNYVQLIVSQLCLQKSCERHETVL